MFKFLLLIVLIAYASQFGVRITDLAGCYSSQCISRLEKAREKILHVDWQPISVWPEEAKKFRH